MKTRQITPDGDEETELMTCRKILGSIVTKVKVNEVTVLPTIGETSGKSLMTSVNTLHNVIFLFLVFRLTCPKYIIVILSFLTLGINCKYPA